MKKKKPRNLLKEYTTDVEGQNVTVSVLKPKNVKAVNHARRAGNHCPNCNSNLAIDTRGLYECSGDKLAFWDQEFFKFYHLPEEKKKDYLINISTESMFFELYDKWVYSKLNNSPEDFNCGYTNNIALPIGSNKVIIPDPLYVSFIQQRLGRPLTEEELSNESELWIRHRRVSTNYTKGAKLVKIPYILFPDEVEVKI